VHDSFLKRAILFFAELKADNYPNSTSLAALCNCSKNTAQRVIYRMRDRHMAPIEYDTSQKGYYLTDSSYVFHANRPISKDDLVALIAASELVKKWCSPLNVYT
jgi:predicted DNA-binding transcriptional regulator YafY